MCVLNWSTSPAINRSSLGAHSHWGTHTVSAVGPPGVYQCEVSSLENNSQHKSVRYVVDYCHSIPCRPVERAAERLSVSPLSSHPPDFKILSALAVKTHASSSTHTHMHTHIQTRYDTHLWIAWRNRNCWEHNKNPIKRWRERKLSRDWCGEANYHSNIINLLHSEFHYMLA